MFNVIAWLNCAFFGSVTQSPEYQCPLVHPHDERTTVTWSNVPPAPPVNTTPSPNSLKAYASGPSLPTLPGRGFGMLLYMMPGFPAGGGGGFGGPCAKPMTAGIVKNAMPMQIRIY